MKHLLQHIVITTLAFLMLMGNTSVAQIRQMIFNRIDTYNGLGDDRVYHILQIRDGRMAITTHNAVSVYDAVTFRNIPLDASKGMRLDAYNGAYHCYVGKNHLLWIKDNHRLKCLDVASLSFVNKVEEKIKAITGKDRIIDFFCDLDGEVWCVTSDYHLVGKERKSYSLPKNKGELQDLMNDDNCLYLFYANTEVVAINKTTGKILYTSRAFTNNRYSGTSLVVPAGKGRFYQLRNDNEGGVCLVFDTKTQKWNTIFTVPYAAHTITVAHKMAYVTTKEEMWEINTSTDEAHVVEQLTLEGTPILTKHMNTVYVDNQGGVWLGSYSNGLLYSHPTHRAPSTNEALELEDYARSKNTSVAYPLMPIITDVNINGTSLQGTETMARLYTSDTLSLEYSQRNATITFNALNYPQPRLTRYLVRLHDKDTLWHSPEELGGIIDDRGSLILNIPLHSGNNTIDIKAMLDNHSYAHSVCIIVERWWAANIPLYICIIIILIHVVLLFSNIRQEKQEESNQSITLDDTNQEFIDKARALVVANLRTKGYSVEQLSVDMCMERTGLYKKMNATIGCSPSAFIRNIRLERAIELLTTNNGMSVQDVAEAVGFNSASYMSRCFVSEYGATPLEYIKKYKKNNVH